MKTRILAILMVVVLLVPMLSGCAADDLKAELEAAKTELAEKEAQLEEKVARIEDLENEPFDPNEFLNV